MRRVWRRTPQRSYKGLVGVLARTRPAGMAPLPDGLVRPGDCPHPVERRQFFKVSIVSGIAHHHVERCTACHANVRGADVRVERSDLLRLRVKCSTLAEDPWFKPAELFAPALNGDEWLASELECSLDPGEQVDIEELPANIGCSREATLRAVLLLCDRRKMRQLSETVFEMAQTGGGRNDG